MVFLFPNNLETAFERIIGNNAQFNVLSADAGADFGGRGRKYCQPVFATHNGTFGKLRKALPVVCRTTAVMRFKPEKMRFAVVGIERNVLVILPGTFDLIDLLVVLMRPHVGRERGGEQIEREIFQNVAPIRVARYFEQSFRRKHCFHHAAKFRSVNRRMSRKTLVARKMSVAHAVKRKDFIQEFFCETFVFFARNKRI